MVDFKVTLSKGWSAIIKRQSELPLPLRKNPGVVLLTSVLAYWLKSLVKRPDEMSATREMVEDLYLSETAELHGLPFLRSEDVDGIRVSYQVNPEAFKILSHSNVITPGGSRIKRSKAIRAILPAPDALQSPPPSPPRAQDPVPIWPKHSQDFLQSLVNVYLPQALWSQFPNDRLRLDTEAIRLRKKPLKLALWPKIVEPLNTTKHMQGKFVDSMNRLFPPNWTSTATEGQLYNFDRDFLQRIRDHIDTKPDEVKSTYSAELRKRIRMDLMQKWDYLPNVQAHKIWVSEGGQGGQRVFRLCTRSN